MDNLSLFPPGVGPQDDFDFPNTGKSKLYKDSGFGNTSDKEKSKRSISSPSRSKRSEDRYDKHDRDRSSDRSPKRSRDRYSERYEREDSYERRSSHRSRRSPSSPSPPQSKRSRQSRDSQQYDRRSYRDQSDNQFMDRPQVYNSNNYQPQQYTQAPPAYGNQPPQFPAYIPAPGNEAFITNSYMGANYIAPNTAHPPPMIGTMITAPPQPETAEGQWVSIPAQQSAQIQPTADTIKREAAIASEKRQQRVTLLKQRDEYLRKVNNLKRELKVLKDQRSELKASTRTPPSPDTYRFLKENSKLQVEISNKLKTMNNVIDMLSGIIGEDIKENENEKRKSDARSDSSPERSTKNGERSFSSDKSSKQNYNYIHYDPEMHWCQTCNVFPKTAKEYLQHLHDPEHLLNMETGPGLEAPWHQILNEDDEEPAPVSGAATKRLPIRGLQHFIASSAWFCKLCNKWIGDLHCASAHLKSKGHAKSYMRFTEQNPHWETDWMADRQKAYERSCNSNPDKIKKDPPFLQNSASVEVSEPKSKKKHSKKEKRSKKKSKKHKKSKSSTSESSSDSETDSSDKMSEDKGSSIRVAMRNKLKQQELEKESIQSKWQTSKNEESLKKTSSPQKPERDDKMLMQWMANKGVLTESDKKMFEALRMRLKMRQEAEAEANKEAEFQKVTPQPSVIPLIREQAEAAAKKQREAEEEAEARKDREKYEAERENERRERERRDREKERDRDYYKDRSYYRDRRRSPGDYRNRYYDKRYSRSPDRRHYRSRSPEHRSRVEAGIITNPPPVPKPTKYEKKKYKNPDADSSDEKEKSKFKRSNSAQASNKKLPFIGRMPVFKSKPKDDSPKNDDDGDKKTGLEKALQKRDEINAQIQKAMEAGTIKCSMEPPPAPFISGHSDQMFVDMAPPPPNISYEDPPIGFVTQQELPPGIESPSALDEIKIPINAAPPNKELPKDFADALDIIFPGERKEGDDKNDENPVAPPPPMPMMVPAYPMETQSYTDYTFALPTGAYETSVSAVPPPMPVDEVQESAEAKDEAISDKKDHPEMDDLAMLGIDESDITAQHF